METKVKSTRKNLKRGISLIVLVITIIVIIILAASIIISLNNNGIINNANKAVNLTNQAQVNALAQTIWADAYLDGARSPGSLRTKVVEGLAKNGITTKDYVTFATENGVEVVPTDTWDHMYTYSQSAGWSSKITKQDKIEDEAATITAKFYKTGKKVTISDEYSGEFEVMIEPEQDEYKLVISGTGSMGALLEYEDEEIYYGWQEELGELYSGEEIVPTFFSTTEIIIEDGIENISEFAFGYAFSLKSITIPSSIRNIQASAVEACINLETIHVSSKEEWNATLIELLNSQLLDATITYDYRTKVERLANEGWNKAYDAGKKTQNALERAVTEYLTANNVSEETLELYEIDVTATGVRITAKEKTLGDVIVSALDYGKTVNYTANGINNWKVLYKQTVDNEEYVYLIASEKLAGNKIPTKLTDTVVNGGAGAKIKGDNIYWNFWNAPSVVASGTINKKRWLANWSDYATYENGRCISYFLDENYWTAFNNTEKYGANVVGAIGTPTLEMIVASYNERSVALGDTSENSTLTLTNGEYGYYINGAYGVYYLRTDNLYTWSGRYQTHVWLSSPSDFIPSAFYDSHLFYWEGNSSVTHFGISIMDQGIRPVVCLKSNTPTRIGVTADSYDYILK